MSFLRKIFSNWVVRNLLIALFVLLAVFAAVNIALKSFTQHDKMVEVPDFVGKSLYEAETMASGDNLKLIVTDSVFVTRFKPGAVYVQNPKAFSKVKNGRKIYVTINALKKRQINMPNLVGLTVRQAKVELSSNGLQLGTLTYVKDIATNNVLAQFLDGVEVLPGAKVDAGSIVDLKVGANPFDAYTVVPSFVELSYHKAVNAVQDSYLNVERLVFDDSVRSYSDSVAAFVYRQFPVSTDAPTPMGRGVTLYLTLDRGRLPKPEPIDSLSLYE